MATIIGESGNVRLVLDTFQGIPVLRRETTEGRILRAKVACVGIRPEYLDPLITALQQMRAQLQSAKPKAAKQTQTKSAQAKPKAKATVQATPVLATVTAEQDVKSLLQQVLKRLGGGA